MFDYIASPYTSPFDDERNRRFQLTEAYTAWCLKQGLWVYSPIVHCHKLAHRYNLPTHFDFWKTYNFAMLERAQTLIVLNLPGWDVSRGVQAEIRFAEEEGILRRHIGLPEIREIENKFSSHTAISE